MKRNNLKIQSIISIVMCIVLVSFCPSAIAAPAVGTDKTAYNYGEQVKVNFSGAPGLDSDWICIAPAGSPDTEGGDYKYMPKGQTEGILAFDSPPAPGQYEVRAFYNYAVKGYVVAARYAFSVGSTAEYEKLAVERQQRLERPINPQNPLEANLSPDKGLVYIVREPWAVSSRADVEIKADGKRIVIMPAKYYLYPAAAGDVTFSTGEMFDRNVQTGEPETAWSAPKSEVTVKVKPGYVTYLKLKVAFGGSLVPILEQVEYREGANLITTYNLQQLK